MTRLFVLAVFLGAVAQAGGAASAPPPRSGPTGWDFLRAAAAGDMGEIAMARLAERRAASADVREFARVIIEDHERARDQALDVLKLAGRAAPKSASPEAEAELRRLRGLNGRAFDREFVRFMAEDHRKDIRVYRDQAALRMGRSSRLAQLTVPVLRKHLRMAQALAPKVGLRKAPGPDSH